MTDPESEIGYPKKLQKETQFERASSRVNISHDHHTTIILCWLVVVRREFMDDSKEKKINGYQEWETSDSRLVWKYIKRENLQFSVNHFDHSESESWKCKSLLSFFSWKQFCDSTKVNFEAYKWQFFWLTFHVYAKWVIRNSFSWTISPLSCRVDVRGEVCRAKSGLDLWMNWSDWNK